MFDAPCSVPGAELTCQYLASGSTGQNGSARRRSQGGGGDEASVLKPVKRRCFDSVCIERGAFDRDHQRLSKHFGTCLYPADLDTQDYRGHGDASGTLTV